jgi:hypothetical protein
LALPKPHVDPGWKSLTMEVVYVVGGPVPQAQNTVE